MGAQNTGFAVSSVSCVTVGRSLSFQPRILMQKQTPAHCLIDPVTGSVPAAEGSAGSPSPFHPLLLRRPLQNWEELWPTLAKLGSKTAGLSVTVFL